MEKQVEVKRYIQGVNLQTGEILYEKVTVTDHTVEGMTIKIEEVCVCGEKMRVMKDKKEVVQKMMSMPHKMVNPEIFASSMKMPWGKTMQVEDGKEKEMVQEIMQDARRERLETAECTMIEGMGALTLPN